MVVSELNILVSFHIYNLEYFDGALPLPNFKIRHGWKTLGCFYYEPGKTTGTSETIEITDFYDFTEEEFRDILVHEMIHYYLHYTGMDGWINHGKAFRRMASRLNREYGLNISVKVDVSNMKPSQKASYLRKKLFNLFM